MTTWEFYAECGEVSIDPGIALENEAVRAAIRADDLEALRLALREEF